MIIMNFTSESLKWIEYELIDAMTDELMVAMGRNLPEEAIDTFQNILDSLIEEKMEEIKFLGYPTLKYDLYTIDGIDINFYWEV